jgi:Uma2 family endonuclease
MSTMVATQPEIGLQPASMPRTEVTPEEFLAMPDGKHYELIDGEPKERNGSLLSSRVASRLNRYLDIYCEEHNLGWILESECGYRCFPWKPGRVRRADLSFIGRERLPSQEQWSEGYVTIAPDLAIEVVSPTDLVSELDEKVEDYLRAGVKLVWVVHPEICKLEVRRGDGSGIWLRADDELSGEDVIPGFRCRVGDLFPKQAEVVAQPKPPRNRRPRPKSRGS